MVEYKKLYALLNTKQKKKALALLGLMLIGMMLEMLGIGLIIPVLILITDIDMIDKYVALTPILVKIGNPSHSEIIVIAMALLISIFSFKSLFLAFLNLKQASFIYGIKADFSQRLFTIYLQQSYIFHLQRNSAQLIRNLTAETKQLSAALMNTTVLISETLVVIGIGVLLLVIEPYGAVIVICTLMLLGFLFNYFTKKYSQRWGEERQYHEGMGLQRLQQGIGGVKDISLLGMEDEFISQYKLHNFTCARVGKHQYVLNSMPRLLLEWFAVLGLVLLVISMIIQDIAISSIIPIVGLFAAAVFKLMPSTNRIIVSIHGLAFARAVINTLYFELCIIQDTPKTKLKNPLLFEKNIELLDLSYCYPKTSSKVLNNTNLLIHKGDSVGFIGASGEGKSTMIDIVLGLLGPTKGKVLVDQVDIQSNMRGWQDKIGYVPQSIFLTDDTLRHNIAFGLADDKIDDSAVLFAIKSAQLDVFIDSLPDKLNEMVGERGVRLSGGQRQRIGIARALYHNPDILVLDEATSALDNEIEIEVMQAINALHGEKTILIIAHRLSTLANCDQVYKLENGKLYKQE
jgi:ATP-binding cassette, subfamily B, bacterial PglK